MGWIQQPHCDGPSCGVEKREGNNWLEAAFSPARDGHLVVNCWTMDATQPHMDRLTFCGIPCLLRRIEQELHGLKSHRTAADAVPESRLSNSEVKHEIKNQQSKIENTR